MGFAEDWKKKVGRKYRSEAIRKCGVCGCESNLWQTFGSTMLGIKTFLMCPGKRDYPELHEVLEKKQDLLYGHPELPASARRELEMEAARIKKFFLKNVPADLAPPCKGQDPSAFIPK
jgi:hypothetical protein